MVMEKLNTGFSNMLALSGTEDGWVIGRRPRASSRNVIRPENGVLSRWGVSAIDHSHAFSSVSSSKRSHQGA
jgi:hypothetical protein